jgi:hypothetical protein
MIQQFQSSQDTAGKIASVSARFTPCTDRRSLLEAEAETDGMAAAGGVFWASPNCSGFGQSRRNQGNNGPTPCRITKSIGGGLLKDHPNIHGKNGFYRMTDTDLTRPTIKNLLPGFVRENPGANHITFTSKQLNQR